MMLLLDVRAGLYFKFHPALNDGIFISLGGGWYQDRRGCLRGPAPLEIVWLWKG